MCHNLTPFYHAVPIPSLEALSNGPKRFWGQMIGIFGLGSAVGDCE